MEFNARQGTPRRYSPYGSRNALPKRSGNGSIERVEAPGIRRFEDCKSWKDGGRERERVPVSRSHGTNVLANKVVRHFSNLTAKGVGTRKAPLKGNYRL